MTDGEESDPLELAYHAHMARLAATPRPEGLRIEVTRGREGPRHDPYGWCRMVVTLADGRWASLREGMLTSAIFSDGSELVEPDTDPKLIVIRFEEFLGLSHEQLDFWACEDLAQDDGVPCMACGCAGCRGSCIV